MLVSPSTAQFLDEPVGRVFLGRTFLIACPDRQSRDLVLWERPDEADVGQILDLLDVSLQKAMQPPIAALVDARRLEWTGDLRPLNALWSGLIKKCRTFEERIQKQALISPSGPASVLVGGFYPGLSREIEVPFETRTFPDLEPALHWLGRTRSLDTFREYEKLIQQAIERNPLLADLHLAIESDPRLHQAGAAKKLYMSPQALQRRLRAINTRFTLERDRARVRLGSKLLLTEAGAKIDKIAFDAGFPTTQRFRDLFFESYGMTPSKWREMNRRSPVE